MKYKVGDKVKIIGSGDFIDPYFNQGDIVTIRKCLISDDGIDDENEYKILERTHFEDGTEFYLYEDEIELVE